MGRREDFARTMRHEKPENLIIDFGGNPLSSMEGESENKLLEFLGFGKKQGGRGPAVWKNTAPGRASFEVF